MLRTLGWGVVLSFPLACAAPPADVTPLGGDWALVSQAVVRHECPLSVAQLTAAPGRFELAVTDTANATLRRCVPQGDAPCALGEPEPVVVDKRAVVWRRETTQAAAGHDCSLRRSSTAALVPIGEELRVFEDVELHVVGGTGCDAYQQALQASSGTMFIIDGCDFEVVSRYQRPTP